MPSSPSSLLSLVFVFLNPSRSAILLLSSATTFPRQPSGSIFTFFPRRLTATPAAHCPLSDSRPAPFTLTITPRRCHSTSSPLLAPFQPSASFLVAGQPSNNTHCLNFPCLTAPPAALLPLSSLVSLASSRCPSISTTHHTLIATLCLFCFLTRSNSLSSLFLSLAHLILFCCMQTHTTTRGAPLFFFSSSFFFFSSSPNLTVASSSPFCRFSLLHLHLASRSSLHSLHLLSLCLTHQPQHPCSLGIFHLATFPSHSPQSAHSLDHLQRQLPLLFFSS